MPFIVRSLKKGEKKKHQRENKTRGKGGGKSKQKISLRQYDIILISTEPIHFIYYLLVVEVSSLFEEKK
jgi:hypothetical protein